MLDVQIRDLIEHLQTFPPEMRVTVEARTDKGEIATGDNYTLVRREDKAVLTVIGCRFEEEQ